MWENMLKLKLYYFLKPIIPRRIQLLLRQKRAKKILASDGKNWPINYNNSSMPLKWSGWPENKKFSLVLTHDVETAKGQARCLELMNIEKRYGFHSAFYFVAERYLVDTRLRDTLMVEGFEVGIHGLKHDGKLFLSQKIFSKRSKSINQYLKEWHAGGFRAPATIYNFEWLSSLDIIYDSSSFDTDPFEPRPVGVNTIFPFLIKSKNNTKFFIELPYTLAQDFTLFIILKEKNIDIWKRKLDWIAQKGGMALLITHPDYINFNSRKPEREEYPIDFYEQFLDYVRVTYKGLYWHALPIEVANYLIKNIKSCG